MKRIPDMLDEKFTYSVELVPPRNGKSYEFLKKKIRRLVDLKIDFLSVTKGAGGSLRGGTIPISVYAQSLGIPAIAHFTCRELSAADIENALIDQRYFEIHNVLALRGDPPDKSNEEEWTGTYKYAYQLVEQIDNMNDGKYIPRKGFDTDEFRSGEPTNFCIGVAAHPNDNPETRVKYLKKKIQAGAKYAITQMIFDADIYSEFMKQASDEGVSISVIPGIFPIDAKWKLSLVQDNFGIKVPEKLLAISNLPDEEFKEKALEFTLDLCRNLKKAGAPGIHLFIFQNVSLAENIIEELRSE